MIPKKTARADLENKKGLIFNISLFISILLVTLAFEWKQPVDNEKDSLGNRSTDQEDVQDVPVTEIPPPPPPKVLESPQIIEVPDEEQIEEEIEMSFDTEITESSRVTDFTISKQEPVEVAREETNEIFLVVEESAVPKDGLGAFYKEIGEKMQYPKQALRMGIEGKVFVQFVVNKDGKLTDFVVVKGIGAGCDEEAIRVLSEAPAWKPGKQRGRPVRQRMVLPITFKIRNAYM